jgi:hypothetical protein
MSLKDSKASVEEVIAEVVEIREIQLEVKSEDRSKLLKSHWAW